MHIHFHKKVAWLRANIFQTEQMKQRAYSLFTPREKLSFFVVSQRKSQGGITIIFPNCEESSDKP